VSDQKQDRIKSIDAALAQVTEAWQKLDKTLDEIDYGSLPPRISSHISEATQRTDAAIATLQFEIGEWRKELDQ
jgi:hypothetical protein